MFGVSNGLRGVWGAAGAGAGEEAVRRRKRGAAGQVGGENGSVWASTGLEKRSPKRVDLLAQGHVRILCGAQLGVDRIDEPVTICDIALVRSNVICVEVNVTKLFGGGGKEKRERWSHPCGGRGGCAR